jgi:Nuclease-related domain
MDGLDDDASMAAGASARREHQRRRAERERRVRRRHPRLGGLVFALQRAPQHERSWQTGAGGEAAVAEALARRCGDRVAVLHDRRLPGRQANIDHIAVAPSGVFVVDTKRYRGSIEVTRPWFGSATLKIAGRDRTTLVDGLARQVQTVTEVVADHAVDVPVFGAFCFVAPGGLLTDSGLPLLRTLTIDGFDLFHPRSLAKRLDAKGRLGPDAISALASALARHFRPA